MIAGQVNAFLEAILQLAVLSPEGHEQAVEVVIDTGFSGYLTLPPDLIAGLGLPFRRHGRALLGDGTAITFDIHEAEVLWGGQRRRIPVDAASTDPLLGMGLLCGHQLGIEVIEDGKVAIAPLLVS